MKNRNQIRIDMDMLMAKIKAEGKMTADDREALFTLQVAAGWWGELEWMKEIDEFLEAERSVRANI